MRPLVVCQGCGFSQAGQVGAGQERIHVEWPALGIVQQLLGEPPGGDAAGISYRPFVGREDRVRVDQAVLGGQDQHTRVDPQCLQGGVSFALHASEHVPEVVAGVEVR